MEREVIKMNVMLDLETLGTKPGCIILSIGAVTFNGDYKFYRNINSNNCALYGLKAEQNTVEWWSNQTQQAKDSLTIDRVRLSEALNDFTKWFKDVKGQQIWCQGANFDVPVLEAAYDAVKFQIPWKFWNVRDTRTVYDITGFDPKTVQREGTYHNALDDCEHQIKCVKEALKNVCSQTN